MRSEARVFTDIWVDGQFLALSPSAQRLYLFFLSQPDLTHVGVLPLRERRWTRTARGLTLAGLEKDLGELEERRFVLVDRSEEEVLVRSLIRRGKVYLQPNVLRMAAKQLATVSSGVIREEIGRELERIHPDAPSPLIASIIEVMLEIVSNYPVKGSANPSGNPSGKTSRSASKKEEVPVVRETTDNSEVLSARARGSRIPADFRVTPEMVAWARERCPHVDGRRETEKFLNYWQAKTGRDATKLDWVATWRNWMLNAAERTPRVAEVSSRRSTSDDRAVAALEAAARVQERLNQEAIGQ